MNAKQIDELGTDVYFHIFELLDCDPDSDSMMAGQIAIKCSRLLEAMLKDEAAGLDDCAIACKYPLLNGGGYTPHVGVEDVIASL